MEQRFEETKEGAINNEMNNPVSMVGLKTNNATEAALCNSQISNLSMFPILLANNNSGMTQLNYQNSRFLTGNNGANPNEKLDGMTDRSLMCAMSPLVMNDTCNNAVMIQLLQEQALQNNAMAMASGGVVGSPLALSSFPLGALHPAAMYPFSLQALMWLHNQQAQNQMQQNIISTVSSSDLCKPTQQIPSFAGLSTSSSTNETASAKAADVPYSNQTMVMEEYDYVKSSNVADDGMSLDNTGFTPEQLVELAKEYHGLINHSELNLHNIPAIEQCESDKPEIFSRGKSCSRSSRSNRNANQGHWTHTEHVRFLVGYAKHGKKWPRLATIVSSRTSLQCRSHAQKFFKKVVKTLGTDISRLKSNYETKSNLSANCNYQDKSKCESKRFREEKHEKNFGTPAKHTEFVEQSEMCNSQSYILSQSKQSHTDLMTPTTTPCASIESLTSVITCLNEEKKREDKDYISRRLEKVNMLENESLGELQPFKDSAKAENNTPITQI